MRWGEQWRIRWELLVRLRSVLGEEKTGSSLGSKVEPRVLTQSQWDSCFLLTGKHKHILTLNFTTPGGPVKHGMVHGTCFTTPCISLCQKRKMNLKFPCGRRARLQAWGHCVLEDENDLEHPQINFTLPSYVFQTTKEHRWEKLKRKWEKWERDGTDIPIVHWRKLRLSDVK